MLWIWSLFFQVHYCMVHLYDWYNGMPSLTHLLNMAGLCIPLLTPCLEDLPSAVSCTGITFQPLNATNKHVPLATECQYASTKSPSRLSFYKETQLSPAPFSCLFGNGIWWDITWQNMLIPNGTQVVINHWLNWLGKHWRCEITGFTYTSYPRDDNKA